MGHKYNDPPVNSFISVHGTVMGVAAFPNCFQQGKPLGMLCKAFAEVLGDLAYNSLVQGILFQADYYRDPVKATGQGYLKNSMVYPNEGEHWGSIPDGSYGNAQEMKDTKF